MKELNSFLKSKGWPINDYKHDGLSHIFHIDLPDDFESQFEELRISLKSKSFPERYSPIVREVGSEALLILIPRPSQSFKSQRTNFYLFIATIFTTTWAGALIYSGYSNYDSESSWLIFTIFLEPRLLLMGFLTFSVPLMTILGVHEMGHYFYAKKHNLSSSLPFFIPLPPPLILGTMGAFISIREPIPNRKALFDVGVSGPIAGFIIAIPITLLGFLLTEMVKAPVPEDTGSVYYLGTPIIFNWLLSIANQIMPLSGAYLTHPVAFAGWAGFLVTAINLFPAGQLDGGHISRALLGNKSKYFSYLTMSVLFFLGFVGIPGVVPPYLGWAIFGILIFFLGVLHPPPSEEITSLNFNRKAVGVFSVLMLIICFVPSPLIPGESPFDISIESSASEFTTASNASFEMFLWLNNTGEIADNLSLSFAHNESWSVSLSSFTIRSVNDTLLASDSNFSSEFFYFDNETNTYSLNLSASDYSNLTIVISVPESAIDDSYTIKVNVSGRNGALYTKAITVIVED